MPAELAPYITHKSLLGILLNRCSDKAPRYFSILQFIILNDCSSGPGFSKLTAALVNVSLKF